MSDDLIENLMMLRAKITKASATSPFHPSVTLIAISKQQPEEKVRRLLIAGHRHFGENRVQDALKRWPSLKQEYPDAVLHFVGYLQSNKVRDVVGWFDAIHSVDSPTLVYKINDQCRIAGKKMPIFIQVNTGNEPQKHGISPDEVSHMVLISQSMPFLDLQGLMCIPPMDGPPSLHFAFLKHLAQKHQLPCLSMGMSDDYEMAIQQGATHLRLGTAIFGQRERSEP